MPEEAILTVTIGLALAYAYCNGLNDAANAIATAISTRVLTPGAGVLMGGIMNLVGALTGTAVAKTIGKGIVDPELMTQAAVMAAIGSAVIWVLVATRYGFPVSVSHSLVAGVLGAGVAVAGFEAVKTATVLKVLMALALSPFFGFIAGFILMVIIYWIFRRATPVQVTTVFSKLQIAAAAFLAYSHGKNDAQNAMGIMAMAWAVYYSAGQNVEVLLWMKLASALMIGIGTALGGWKVIQTLGMKVTRLQPVHGFSANLCAAGVIEAASNIGLPVSTTHTSSSSIMGVGATRRLSAVRWGVTRGILWAWLVTYPFCAVVGWCLSKVLNVIL
ncbi:MAG: inorganic phosphate transporter [Chloroflexota bacterium]|nr:inorganic phosphate transporter [Chloroflexota bacterium]